MTAAAHGRVSVISGVPIMSISFHVPDLNLSPSYPNQELNDSAV
jgi:hypothetical protein